MIKYHGCVGSGSLEIHSWIRNKSFRIHNTDYVQQPYPMYVPLVAVQVFLPLEILPAVVAPEGPVRLLAQMRHLTNDKKIKH